MVTAEEYAKMQNDFDAAASKTKHRIASEIALEHGRSTSNKTDEQAAQNRADGLFQKGIEVREAYENRKKRSGRVTQEEYTRFQNSYGFVSDTPKTVPYSMRSTRPQGTYTGIPMTPEEIAEEKRLQDLAWKMFHERGTMQGMTLEEYEQELKKREQEGGQKKENNTEKQEDKLLPSKTSHPKGLRARLGMFSRSGRRYNKDGVRISEIVRDLTLSPWSK